MDQGPFSLLLSDPVAFFMNVENWWTAATTIATAVFTVISWLNQQSAKKKAEQAEEQVRLMQVESLRTELNKQIAGWGAEVIASMARCEQFVLSRGLYASAHDFDVARRAFLAEFSGLIDKGRIYFDNVSRDLVGLDRPLANRGFRRAILDAIVLYYERLNRLDVNAEAAAIAQENGPMFQARRAFVSELQAVIDPGAIKEVIEAIDVRRRQAQAKAGEKRDDWASVRGLVDQFEAQFGGGSFWKERPRSREELLKERAANA